MTIEERIAAEERNIRVWDFHEGRAGQIIRKYESLRYRTVLGMVAERFQLTAQQEKNLTLARWACNFATRERFAGHTRRAILLKRKNGQL